MDHRSISPVPKIEEDCYDWYERHVQKVRASLAGAYRVFFIGDSITHFWEGDVRADHGSSVWKKYFASRDVLNLGFGYDRTQNVLWRLTHGEGDKQNPEWIIVNIGTNQFSETSNYPMDTPENACAGIIRVWEMLFDLFPQTNLIAMALFPRGGFSRQIRETNHILKKSHERFPFVKLIDLTYQLGDKSGAPLPENYQADLCHLSEAGYRIWVNSLPRECLSLKKRF